MNDPQTTPFRVLLASDNSEAARHAEAWVARLRRPGTVIVDVVCVAHQGISRLGWGTQPYGMAVRQAVEKLRQNEVQAAERIANEVGERLRETGLTIHAWARQGDPADELLAAIDAGRPDLVVLAPRGRSELVQLLLGSVSRQVIAETTGPVLVARRPPGDAGPLPRNILILVDGTLAAEAAIDWLTAAGWLHEARVTLLGLLGVTPGVGTDEPDLAAEVSGSMSGDVAIALDRLVERVRGEAAEVTTELEIGHPLQGTLELAEQRGPDLVVVARSPRPRGHDPFAEKVARYLSTSVLIVPTA